LQITAGTVIERFAGQLAVLAGSCGGLSGEVGVGGCEMPDADELEGCDAPVGRQVSEVALRLVTVGEQLLVDVIDARLAEVFEPQRVVVAFGEAVAAVAVGVRACR
jgi:hypothetical protein